MDAESSRHDNLESIFEGASSEPRTLPLEYLRNITNDFSEELLLGEGGFGKVYKGVKENGETIAVKRLSPSIPEVSQFENEARHLMKLNHPNIVPLVAYCFESKIIYVEQEGKYFWAEKPERLLCLEYMPEGSLRGCLSDESCGLDWDRRYKIIEGICFGLHYLHEEWNPKTPIIHMDLKPANILLDVNMVPKIADFGLSRLFGEEQTRTCTTNCFGTWGYKAPEYINRGTITKELDIFSLGVIIIEIVTGHKNYPEDTEVDDGSSQRYIELVLKNWRTRMENSQGYTSVEINYQQIALCIAIGLVCVKLDRMKRPTTSQIITMLRRPGSADGSIREGVVQPEQTHDNKDGAQTVVTVAEETFADRRKQRSPASRPFRRFTEPRPAEETIAQTEKRGTLVFQPIGGATFYPTPTERDERTNCSII